MLKTIGLIALWTIVVHTVFVEENNIILVNDDNFEDVLKLDYVLVEFHASSCELCKSNIPEYERAATMLKEEGSNIRIAMVDATDNPLISKKYETHDDPIFKFFRKGSAIDYNGDAIAEAIVNWVKKKTEPPSKTIRFAKDINEFKKTSDVVVIGYFKDVESKSAQTFQEVADSVENVPFAISSESGVRKALGFSEEGIILYKKFDERKAVFEDELTVETLKSFISVNRLPDVVEFNQKTAFDVFGGELKTQHLLFISKDSDDYESIHDAFKKVAKTYKGKLLFVQIDVAEEENKAMLDFFALNTDDIPTTRIVFMGKKTTKYKPEFTDMTMKNIAEFTADFVAGKLTPDLPSEEIPEDWDKNPVKVLVGKNFRDVAFDKTKNVFVKFYAPWCGHCKNLIPVWEKLAEKYADDENVIIAKLDATKNELDEVQIESFPTIKFFPAGSDEIIDFTGKQTLKGFSKFIDAGGKVEKKVQSVEDSETVGHGHEEL